MSAVLNLMVAGSRNWLEFSIVSEKYRTLLVSCILLNTFCGYFGRQGVSQEFVTYKKNNVAQLSAQFDAQFVRDDEAPKTTIYPGAAVAATRPSLSGANAIAPYTFSDPIHQK